MFGKNKSKEKNESLNAKKEDSAGKKAGIGIVLSKQGYETSVGKKALERAGKCKNLHGHVNEILTVDKYNRNPVNILQNKKAVLTKSPIAVRDDIVVMQGKKVVGRKQLKDTVAGVQKTVKQAANHKYKGTSLEGTVESTKAYSDAVSKSKVSVTQKMKSNGISTDQTHLIQAKTIGGNILKNKNAIMREAGRSGVAAGAISGAVGTVNNGVKVYKGEETVGRAAVNVAKDSAVGAASGAVGNTVATITTVAVASTPAAPVAPIAGAVAGAGAAYLAGEGTNKALNYGEKKISELKKASKSPVLNV